MIKYIHHNDVDELVSFNNNVIYASLLPVIGFILSVFALLFFIDDYGKFPKLRSMLRSKSRKIKSIFKNIKILDPKMGNLVNKVLGKPRHLMSVVEKREKDINDIIK